MSIFIALYRGINVGGKNSVKMQALRALHESLDHASLKSYVQSGNVVFKATGTAAGIATKLTHAFHEQFGFKSAVQVRTAKEWQRIIKANPYAKAAEDDPTKVHVAIGDGKFNAKRLKALLEKTGGPEEFAIKTGVLYLHAPDGVGRSKFAARMEAASEVSITARNWRTVEALAALAEQLS